MFWQLHKPANVDELEIGLAQSGVRVRPAHADVVIDPEGDVAPEVAGGEQAE
jgi:hypothetical protein